MAALVDVPLSELLERLPIDRADAEALAAFFMTGTQQPPPPPPPPQAW